jgi:putative endonuclease
VVQWGEANPKYESHCPTHLLTSKKELINLSKQVSSRDYPCYGLFLPNKCIITSSIIMPTNQFCVYIMTNEQHSLLYTGRTGNLKHRIAQHRSGNGGITTRRHNLIKLVYYETTEDATAAKLRERQLKRSSKKKRLSLIEAMNPEWADLFDRL